MFDAVIVGAGPAGLSAALALVRARRRVLVCDGGPTRNDAASEMHGFLSREGTSPSEFLAKARDELLLYPTVEIVSKAVTAISKDGAFSVEFSDRRESARRIILATGMIEELPPIRGLRERWGTSVFSCPYCDGWEMRDRPLAIAGDRRDLVPLAQELYQWSRELTICGFDPSSGSPDEQAWIRQTGVATKFSTIASLDGPELTIKLNDADALVCAALFLCVPLVQRSDLGARLGCATSFSGRLKTNTEQQTSVDGVYAAGDASAHTHQVVMAAATGAAAGIAVNNDLCIEDVESVLEAGRAEPAVTAKRI
jgi:thioredoxin reductase